MDPIETAIRNAFDKGDALDSAYRQRVYRSAVVAMEKALQANQSLTPDAVERRRESVREKIAEIESEFVPAAEAEAAPPVVSADERYTSPVVAAPPVSAGEPDPDIDFSAPPMVEAETRAGPQRSERPIEPEAVPERRSNHAAELGGVDGRGFHRHEKGGNWLLRLLPMAAVVLIVGAAIWWAASNGLFRAPETVAEAPADTEAAPQPDPAGAPLLPDSEAAQNWITVFSPDDPTQVSATGSASAEVMEDDSGRFMRIRSGSDGAPVGFTVGQGILERIAGQRAVFDVVARAEEGMATEIAIECDFGGLGDCGRKRYQVNYERGDFLFEVGLPEGSPSAGGTIAITSDVENGGKAIDVYEIRVSIGGE